MLSAEGDEDPAKHLPDQPGPLRPPPLLLHHPGHPRRLTHQLLADRGGNGENLSHTNDK